MTKKIKQIDWRIVITGLVCITGIEITALFMGINGVLLTTIVALIAGVIGVTLPQVKFK